MLLQVLACSERVWVLMLHMHKAVVEQVEHVLRKKKVLVVVMRVVEVMGLIMRQ